MKKTSDVAGRGRPGNDSGQKSSKKSRAALEQAAEFLRTAKEEFKRLRLLAKAAKRGVKEARKALKKARKQAPGGVAKSAAKPRRKSGKKPGKKPAAKATSKAAKRKPPAVAKPKARATSAQPSAGAPASPKLTVVPKEPVTQRRRAKPVAAPAAPAAAPEDATPTVVEGSQP